MPCCYRAGSTATGPRASQPQSLPSIQTGEKAICPTTLPSIPAGYLGLIKFEL